MQIPRVDHLITKVREETDNLDTVAVSDYEILGYINDGQRTIQGILYEANSGADLFVRDYKFEIAANQSAYDLPADIYAESSVVSVSVMSASRIVKNIPRASFRERVSLFSYSTRADKILLTNTSNLIIGKQILMTYNALKPKVGLRIGKIASIAGQIVTLESNDLEGFETRFEYVTANDKYGQANLVTDSLDNEQIESHYIDSVTGLAVTLEGDLSNLQVGQYLVTGDMSTTHSKLPPEAENHLKAYIMRRILKRNSSNELSSQNIFTNQERKDLIDLFKDNIKDPIYPAILDDRYMGY